MTDWSLCVWNSSRHLRECSQCRWCCPVPYRHIPYPCKFSHITGLTVKPDPVLFTGLMARRRLAGDCWTRGMSGGPGNVEVILCPSHVALFEKMNHAFLWWSPFRVWTQNDFGSAALSTTFLGIPWCASSHSLTWYLVCICGECLVCLSV